MWIGKIVEIKEKMIYNTSKQIEKLHIINI